MTTTPDPHETSAQDDAREATGVPRPDDLPEPVPDDENLDPTNPDSEEKAPGSGGIPGDQPTSSSSGA